MTCYKTNTLYDKVRWQEDGTADDTHENSHHHTQSAYSPFFPLVNDKWCKTIGPRDVLAHEFFHPRILINLAWADDLLSHTLYNHIHAYYLRVSISDRGIGSLTCKAYAFPKDQVSS